MCRDGASFAKCKSQLGEVRILTTSPDTPWSDMMSGLPGRRTGARLRVTPCRKERHTRTMLGRPIFDGLPCATLCMR